VGVGGHALLVAARAFGIRFPLSPKARQSPAEVFYDGRGFSPIGESWRRYRLAVDLMGELGLRDVCGRPYAGGRGTRLFCLLRTGVLYEA